MTKLYRDADGHAERLPWHRETPSHLLSAAVAELGGRGRALDAGCGAGVLSVWLAERGLEVTGIDLLPEAIAMARSVTRQRFPISSSVACRCRLAYTFPEGNDRDERSDRQAYFGHRGYWRPRPGGSQGASRTNL
jgi:SAM-dependent methyltransferase